MRNRRFAIPLKLVGNREIFRKTKLTTLSIDLKTFLLSYLNWYKSYTKKASQYITITISQ